MELNEELVATLFDLLERRQPFERIAGDTNTALRTVQRISKAKRLMDAGINPGDWPKEFRSAWPKLAPSLVEWHRRWQAERDLPEPGARRRHADLLVRLGLKIRKMLETPSTSSWLLISDMYWDQPLVPTKVDVPPRFQFQDDPEFTDLASHIHELGRALPGILAEYVRYADAFKTLRIRAKEVLLGAFPGLPEGVPADALVSALLSEVMNLARNPGATLNSVQLEPGAAATSSTSHLRERT